MPHARAPPPPPAGPWRGVRDEPSGRRACVPGRNGKDFTNSFLMRRDSISAEALQLRRPQFAAHRDSRPMACAHKTVGE
jgi:hypothetical protein